jgi:hypothetical protein
VPPWTRADGTVVQGRWRATHVDLDGKIERVSGTTTALAESVRDGLVTALARRASPTNSRFSITTTVQELSDWWLDPFDLVHALLAKGVKEGVR